MSDYVRQLRARLGPARVILVYATALLRDARGGLLFQRRADFGWWGLPGGVLEIGETPGACAAREAREETGLEAQPVRLVGVYSGPQYDVRYPNGDEVQQFTAAFECRLIGGDGRADGREALEQAFFPPEAPPPTSPWYAAMARDLQAARPTACFEAPRPGVDGAAGGYLAGLRARLGRQEVVAPGAGAFIRDEAGRILLIRRADNHTWSVPAGIMDLGESIAETAVRETAEETGLQVEPVRLVSLHSGPDYRVTYPNGDRLQICSALFECRVLGGALRPDGHETLDARFFPPDALPEPMAARTRRRLAEALQGRPGAFFN